MQARTKICRFLALLRLHNKNCERCRANETQGRDISKRLDELSTKTSHSSTAEQPDKGVEERLRLRPSADPTSSLNPETDREASR